MLIYTLLMGKMPFTCTKLQSVLTDISKNIVCIHYKLEGMKVSQQCKDVIKQLLIIDTKKRIDKIKFFSHPFVRSTPSKYRQLHPSSPPSSSLCKPLTPDSKFEAKASMGSSSDGTVFYRSSSDTPSVVTSQNNSPKGGNERITPVILPNKV